MTNEQTLGGESVRLNIHVRTGNVPQETRFSDVGVAANDQSPGVGVDRGQTTKMLAHLFEVKERVLKALANSGHATQASALQLLALEERLAILEQTHVIPRHRLNQMFRRGELTQRNAEMVGIVKSVEEIFVERMNVLKLRETLEDRLDFLGEGLGGVLHFARIESFSRRNVSAYAFSRGNRWSSVPRILLILKPALI